MLLRLLYFLLLGSIVHLSHGQSTELSESTQDDALPSTTRIYSVIDELPYLSNAQCQYQDQLQHKKCNDKVLADAIQQRLVYPYAAKASNVEGTVVIRVVVEKDGTLTSPSIRKDIGGGCGEEALRIVQSLTKFVPAKRRGQQVRAKYDIPVTFALK